MIYEESGKVDYFPREFGPYSAYLSASFTASGTEYYLAVGKHSDQQILLVHEDDVFKEVERENTN